MHQSIAAPLIGILVLVYATGLISHGHAVTRQRRSSEADNETEPSVLSVRPSMDGSYVTHHNGTPIFHEMEEPPVEDDSESAYQNQTVIQANNMIEAMLQGTNTTKPDNTSLARLSQEQMRQVLYELALGIHYRRKRFATSNENARWTNAVIPFIITATDEANFKAFRAAQAVYEKTTCVKFVPWDNGAANSNYSLGHLGYLNFITHPGCWSYIGNLGWSFGQPISCCGSMRTCLHEIGHAFGFGHEQQSPEENFFVRINWENIEKSRYSTYSPYSAESFTAYRHYDVMSRLHYSQTAFTISPNRRSWTSLFPELGQGHNTYYISYDFSASHNCRGLFCSDFQTTCVNDGFTSVRDGECICMCPYGLDGATGCRTTITEVRPNITWPGGNYSLIATVDGCPGNNVFSPGEVIHWGVSPITVSDDFHLAGDYQTAEAKMQFCSLNNGASEVTWPTGVYCIQRLGGSCPTNFEEGYIQFANDPQSDSSLSGTYPDGVYDDNTRFEYCCRDDGIIDFEMCLPTTDSFALFMYKDQCQVIAGMLVTKEYYGFTNAPGNLAGSGGAHPSLMKENDLYSTFICYYTPLQMNCGGVYELNSVNRSVVITSPNYPSSYNSATECNWLITGPKGSTIVLDFDDFNVELQDDLCYDYLEIRNALLGQPGVKHCGTGFDNSVRSIFNTTALRFRTDLTVNLSGFNLTATVVLPEDLAYNIDDRGRTYRGNVNFTRHMEPCVPWNQIRDAEFSPYNRKYFTEGLEGNYCRNPNGKGYSPWCYTGYDPQEGWLRNYCDVSLKERIYDAWEDCAVQPANFCEESPQAFKGCAKTCASSLPPLPSVQRVSDISCSAPTIPPDGQLISTPKSTYAVGEAIEIQCSTPPNSVMTAYCQTDGNFNIGPNVCGVCPDGWSRHIIWCYKHFPEKRNYTDAQSRCREFGGSLASTDDADLLNLVMALRPTMSAALWLGADKIETVEWTWDVGHAVSSFNWMDGQPDNPLDNHCACISQENTDFQWKDELCTMFYEFVCVIGASVNTRCFDRRGDCEEIFSVNPTVFAENGDFAIHECFHTSGYCNGTTCTVPDDAVEAVITSNHVVGGTISRSQILEYECNNLYNLNDGDLRRVCMPNGTFTGLPPRCSNLEFAASTLSDVEIKARSEVGENKKVYSGPTNQFKITRSGEICKWILHTKYTGMISLQIWRPQGGDSYKYIGQNILATSENGTNTFEIYKGDMISVRPNDVVGIYYPGFNEGGVSFDYCDDLNGMSLRSVDDFDDVTDFVPDSIHTFEGSSDGCRIFSVNAEICPEDTYVNNSNKELVAGTRKGIDLRVFSSRNAELAIGVNGTIVAYSYHCLQTGPVTFQVYEYITATRLTLLGQNPVTAEVGFHMALIPEEDQITVKEGDFLGLYYGDVRGMVTMDLCPEGEDDGTMVRSSTSIASMTVGNTYDFPLASCRRLNFKALIRVDTPAAPQVTGIDGKVLLESGFELASRRYGIIDEWHYTSLSAGSVAFQVWRQTSESRYILVGQNPATVSAGTHTIQVADQDKISVQAGDLIGIYYDLEERGQITMDLCDDETESSVLQTSATFSTSAEFAVGSTYTFATYATSCHIFNVNVTMTTNDQPFTGTDRRAFIGAGSGINVPTGGSGTILEWHYFSYSGGSVAFQVYRPVANTNTSFQFVGQTLVTVQAGTNTIQIDEQDRFTVQNGDIVGVFYDVDGGQVPMIECDSPDEGLFLRSKGFYDHTAFTAGVEYDFEMYSGGCKRLSVSTSFLVESNNKTIAEGDRRGTDNQVFAGTIDELHIPLDGKIYGFEYHSLSNGPVGFQVLEYVSDFSYTFLGQNFVTVTTGFHTLTIPEADRLTVREGEYLGIYYPLHRGQVSLFNCLSSSEGNVVKSYTLPNDQTFVVGQTYGFAPSITCKRFNFKALIQVDQDPPPPAPQLTGIDGKVLLASGVQFAIGSSGTIDEWHYTSMSAGSVAFQIWRRISDTSYELVGQNSATVSAGTHTIQVAEQDRISAQAGDFIGIYYGVGERGQITMDFCNDQTEGSVLQSVTTFSTSAGFTVGSPYTFATYRSSCHRFSVTTTMTLDATPPEVTGIDGKVFLESGFALAFRSSGTIDQWDYTSLSAGPVAFQIWRQTSDTSYTLVGQNSATVSAGTHTIQVAEQDRISVEVGDHLAIYYGPERGQIFMNPCDDQTEGSVLLSSATFPTSADFTVGDPYTFATYNDSCHRFNVLTVMTVRDEPFTGTDRKAYIGAGSALNVPAGVYGTIMEWHYTSYSDGDVAFQVYRPVANSDTRFEFVGQNRLTVQAGTHTIPIDELYRFTVQNGDIVGIYYDDGRGQVPMIDCDSPDEGLFLRSTAFYDHTDFTVGPEYGFEMYSGGCKRLNVSTTLLVESNNRTIAVGDRRGGDRKVFIGTIKDLYVPSDGIIYGFEYHCLQGGPVYFQVWEYVSDFSYIFRGQHFAMVSTGFHTLIIPEAERMTVRKGDYLGIYYPPNRGQVSMFNCQDSSEGNVVKSNTITNNGNFVVDQTYGFATTITCKRFNFKALIQVN